MTLRPTARFATDYESLPQPLRQRVDKALGRLLENPRHPSLQVKKMKGFENRWEGRVTLHYRFTFSIDGDENLISGLVGVRTAEVLATLACQPANSCATDDVRSSRADVAVRLGCPSHCAGAVEARDCLA